MRFKAWLRRVFRPRLVILDIYGFDRTMTLFMICHGEDLVQNIFTEDPLFKRLKEPR